MGDVQIGRVLAAVDFSDWTGPVLRTAADVAGKFSAALTVVYAEMFLPPPYFTERGIERLAEVLATQKGAATEHLAEMVDAELGGGKADVRLVESSPTEGILRTAEQVDAGLIVMGTHGRSGFNRLLLGSVAERVLRETGVPLLTVRGSKTGGSESPVPFTRILCPINYTPVSEDALKLAVEMARRSDAELVLMTSLEDGDESSNSVSHHEERLCAGVPAGVQAHCSLRSIVRRGDAAEQILQMAQEEQCDLIVIGAQHRPLLQSTIIGTTSVRVMRHAVCPVLTVPRHVEES